jgi:Sterol-sensing domain of SREBP cleavage-activation
MCPRIGKIRSFRHGHFLDHLVAFAISSASTLPALASFCAYASICIAFLYVFASTFFKHAWCSMNVVNVPIGGIVYAV